MNTGRNTPLIGTYQVTDRLGTGGMGVVYAGTHPTLRRPVAIKTRRRSGDPSETLQFERFLQGAILQAELDHPYIARVYDYVVTENLQALVMEYLGGGSVEDWLSEAGGPLPISVAIEIGVRAAEAMSFAHAKGVIHRDMKPGNLMLVDKGVPETVRVTDFGVAKAPERSPDLTVVGAAIGTVWYMSPEQFNGDRATPGADVYSLGATLYEMLTGQIPFESAQTAEVFKRFLDGAPPPPILSLNPYVPPALAAIVDLSLALDPRERLPSAASLSLLLRAVAAREGIILGGTVSRRLLSTMDRDAFGDLLGSVPGGIGRELRTSWSLFEDQMHQVGEQSGSSFGAADSGEITSVSISPLSLFGDFDDDDDDEDQTIVMRIGPIEEE